MFVLSWNLQVLNKDKSKCQGVSEGVAQTLAEALEAAKQEPYICFLHEVKGEANHVEEIFKNLANAFEHYDQLKKVKFNKFFCGGAVNTKEWMIYFSRGLWVEHEALNVQTQMEGRIKDDQGLAQKNVKVLLDKRGPETSLRLERKPWKYFDEYETGDNLLSKPLAKHYESMPGDVKWYRDGIVCRVRPEGSVGEWARIVSIHAPGPNYTNQKKALELPEAFAKQDAQKSMLHPQSPFLKAEERPADGDKGLSDREKAGESENDHDKGQSEIIKAINAAAKKVASDIVIGDLNFYATIKDDYFQDHRDKFTTGTTLTKNKPGLTHSKLDCILIAKGSAFNKDPEIQQPMRSKSTYTSEKGGLKPITDHALISVRFPHATKYFSPQFQSNASSWPQDGAFNARRTVSARSSSLVKNEPGVENFTKSKMFKPDNPEERINLADLGDGL